MSTEHNTFSPSSSHSAHGMPEPLRAAEKLALSRQALQTALFPPPKPKKPGVIGSLRKLWPSGRKETKTSQPATMPAAAAQPAMADDAAPRLLAQRKRQEEGKGVVQAVSGKASASSNLQQAVSSVFDRMGSLAGKVVKSRWRRHPLNWALQVGEPLLEAEIRRRPIPWLAGAAAVGAAFVLLNPLKWRQSRQMVGTVLGQEVRVLATSGLVFLATSILGEFWRRSGADQSEPGQS
ncbi:MAG: hypothetical protein Q4A28_02215 [Brachymonas sp.]|nr:hypothetical protein [Brachymonas sp.]